MEKTAPKRKLPKAPSITIADRIESFPGEGLVQEPVGTLWCSWCKSKIKNWNNTTNIKQHLKRKKHLKQREKRRQQERPVVGKETIVDYFLKAIHDEEDGLKAGTSVPDDTHVERMKAIRALLKGGVDLNVFGKEDGDELKQMIEDASNISIGTDRSCREYIPPLRKADAMIVHEEIAGQHLSLIFDATTRVHEAAVVLVRYCRAGTLSFQHRVLALRHFGEPLTGNKWAKFIRDLCVDECGIEPANVLFTMQDRVEANRVACNALSAVWHPLLPISCMSHTLDKLGSDVFDQCSQETKDFLRRWNKLTSKDTFINIFVVQYGKTLKKAGGVRWRSRDDVINEKYTNWKHLKHLFDTCISQKRCVKTVTKLISAYNSVKGWEILMDFAVVLDVGLPSYAAMYNLEGDNFLAPLVVDELLKPDSYRTHWNYANPQTHPKVRQVAHARYPVSPVTGNPDPDPHIQVRKQWIETTLLKGTLAWNYFHDTVMKRDAEMEPERMHFEGAQLWHPGVA